MSWAKLDDKASEHRKQLAAGGDACWFWACGLMYANRQEERDGFIPEQILPALYGPAKSPKKLAAILVRVGLWKRVEGGYLIHDYHVWNPNAVQVEHYKTEARRRAAESYERKKSSAGAESPQNEIICGDSSGSTPTPTPEPDLTQGGLAKDLEASARRPAPPDPPPTVNDLPPIRSEYVAFERSFQPIPRAIETWSGPINHELLRANYPCLDLSEQERDFRDHARSKGSLSCDWDAEFARWLRRSKRFAEAEAMRHSKAPGLIEHEQRQRELTPEQQAEIKRRAARALQSVGIQTRKVAS